MFGFGKVLDVLRLGDAVRRAEWPGLVLVLAPDLNGSDGVPVDMLPDGMARHIEGERAIIPSYLATISQAGVVAPWVPSSFDLLAEDWDYVRAQEDRA